jgi:large repetitive protein
MTANGGVGTRPNQGMGAVKNLLRAACLGVVVLAVGMGGTAFAAQSNDALSTSVAITSSKMSPKVAYTGSSVTFRAQVSPNLIAPKTHITGTVAWTITGSDGSAVTCAKTYRFANPGRSTCIVKGGQLLASASPYTVTATYSGDANFATSTTSFSQPVVPKTSTLRIHFSSPPASDTATSVTVAVKGGTATSLLGGTVYFSVTGTGSTSIVSCTNGTTVPHSGATKSFVLGSNGDPSNEATCTLPAGWLILQGVAPGRHHPKAFWSVTVSYLGNTNFTQVIQRQFRGSIRG